MLYRPVDPGPAATVQDFLPANLILGRQVLTGIDLSADVVRVFVTEECAHLFLEREFGLAKRYMHRSGTPG